MPVPIDRPGRNEWPDRGHGAGETTQRAAACEGWADAARLSAGLSGPAPGAELHEPLAGVLRGRVGRLEYGLGAAGTAGRYDCDACRTLQVRPSELCRSADDTLRWHDVADAEGNAGKADHDQGGR